jgi:hypothetical protein
MGDSVYIYVDAALFFVGLKFHVGFCRTCWDKSYVIISSFQIEELSPL